MIIPQILTLKFKNMTQKLKKFKTKMIVFRSSKDKFEIIIMICLIQNFKAGMTASKSQYQESGLRIREHIGKLFSLFLIQNICCGFSKHMFKSMGKKIIKILRK